MRTLLLIILLNLFFTQSYAQDFSEIQLDLQLQAKHSDTLANLGDRLTGNWKYLGKQGNRVLSDTLYVISESNQKTYVVVEDGNMFELTNGERKQTDYYYERTYEVNNAYGFHLSRKKNVKLGLGSNNSQSNPTPIQIVYYKEKFGILYTGISSQTFSEIIELTPEKLVLSNGKEHLRIK